MNAIDEESAIAQEFTKPIVSESNVAPPNTSSSSTDVNREDTLAIREELLREREKRVALEEDRLRSLGARIDQAPNWPVCFPIVHHDLSNIPQDYMPMMQWLYYYWYGLSATAFLNFCSTLSILLSGAQSVTTGGSDFAVALVYFLIVIPSSFFSWYRSAYHACMLGNRIYFLLFFAFFGIHTLFCIYMAMGIPATGGGGLINMLSMIAARKTLSATLLVISTVLWFLNVLLSIIFLKWIHMHYVKQKDSNINATQELPLLGTVIKSLFSG